MTTIDEKDFTNIINEFNVYWDMNKDLLLPMYDYVDTKVPNPKY